MDISEVSKRSGLPASTLRYYEEKGLITSIGRSGIRRVYHDSILERLSLIVLGRSSGFTLDEISRIFISGGMPNIDRGLLSDKAEELDRQIQELTAVRNGLRHAAECPEDNHLECPRFQRLMKLAVKRTARRPLAKR